MELTIQEIIPQRRFLVERVMAPSPMRIVRSLTTSSEEARSAITYFHSTGVSGSGFGGDNANILGAMGVVHKALLGAMRGTDFFISMIPEHYLHARPEIATAIPDEQPVPDFFAAFEPLRAALISQAAFFDRIDADLHVDTGREFCGRPKPPQLRLRVLGRIDGSQVVKELSSEVMGHGSLAVDPKSDAFSEVLRWFAGAAHGLVVLKWRTGR